MAMRSKVTAGLCLLGIAAAYPTDGRAQGHFATGNTLLRECEGNRLNQPSCLAYMSGLADGLALLFELHPQSSIRACVPDKVTVSQIRDVVLKYLREKPEDRHEAASTLGLLALVGAFPCKK